MKRYLLMISVCLFTQTAWAGWVVTYKDAETGQRSQEFYEGDKANFGDLIFTGKHFILVAQDARAYWKGTPGQYCDALTVWKKKIQAQMANLPAPYRPKPISQKKVTRKKLDSQSIAGFSATGYEFNVDGSQEGRIWVSSDSGLSGIIDYERSLSRKMCFEKMESMDLEGSRLYKQTVDGAFILKESHRQVVSVKKQSVPASRFVEPSGYKAFIDYEQFMEYASDNSGGSSGSGSDAPPSFDMDSYEDSQPRDKNRAKKRDETIIEKDARDIGQGAAEEAHESTKRGIQDGISEDIQEGVGKLLDKLGF